MKRAFKLILACILLSSCAARAQTTTGGTISGAGAAAVALPPSFLTGPTAGSITSTTTLVAWTTDISSNSQVSCGANGGPYTVDYPASPDAALVTSHSIPVGFDTPLTPSTTYYCVGKSQAAIGGVATSSQFQFTTAASLTCGPPGYLCGDTSTTNHPWQAWPVAAQTVNTVFNDPVFGNRMVRAVDSTGACNTGLFTAVASGISDSAENNHWASDSSHYIVRLDLSGNTSLFVNDFNTTTMQSTPHAGTGSGVCRTAATATWLEISGSGRFKASGGAAIFSFHNPNILYGVGSNLNTTIKQLDLSTNTFSTVKLLTDADCFTDLSAFSTGDTSVSADGSRIFWFGNKNSDATKGQDHYTQFVVYFTATGACRRLDSSTGIVSEGTTATGFSVGTTPSTFRSATSHNARMSKDGKRVTITFQSCSAGCTGFSNTGRVLWNVETTDILLPVLQNTAPTTYAGTIGHSAMGNHSLITGYNAGSTPNNYSYNNLWDLTANPVVNDTRYQAPPFEHYLSWSNANAAETMPYLYNTWRTDGLHDSTVALQNEDTMIFPTGAQAVSRQSKICTFANTASISISNPRSTISPVGDFILRSDRGNACSQDIGRGDLFIVETQ